MLTAYVAQIQGNTQSILDSLERLDSLDLKSTLKDELFLGRLANITCQASLELLERLDHLEYIERIPNVAASLDPINPDNLDPPTNDPNASIRNWAFDQNKQ